MEPGRPERLPACFSNIPAEPPQGLSRPTPKLTGTLTVAGVSTPFRVVRGFQDGSS